MYEGDLPGLEYSDLVATYGRYLAGDKAAHTAWAALHCSGRGKALARLAPEIKKAMDETGVRAYRADGSFQVVPDHGPAVVVHDSGPGWSGNIPASAQFMAEKAAGVKPGKAYRRAQRDAARKTWERAEKKIRAEADAEVLVSLSSPHPADRELAWQLMKHQRSQVRKSADPWGDARGAAAVLAFTGASPHHHDPQMRELYWQLLKRDEPAP